MHNLENIAKSENTKLLDVVADDIIRNYYLRKSLYSNRIILCLLSNPYLSLESTIKLLKWCIKNDGILSFHETIAKNCKKNAEVWKLLLKLNDPFHANVLLKQEDCPTYILYRYCNKEDISLSILRAIVNNPNTPTWGLRKLYEKAFWQYILCDSLGREILFQCVNHPNFPVDLRMQHLIEQ